MQGNIATNQYRTTESENKALRRAIHARENQIAQLQHEQTEIMLEKNEYIKTLEEANNRLITRVYSLEEQLEARNHIQR